MGSVTESLNQARWDWVHLKSAVIAGIGYFTDAYDLFVIGAALELIKTQWHLDAITVGLVGSIALFAAFVGALIFGRVADLWGRHRLYGLEAALMTVGALLSAVAWAPAVLMGARAILGLGIGGDYSVSGVLMSEYANVKDRGRMVAIVFSMQAVGLIAGPMVSLTLLASEIGPQWVWRLILAFGAIPAAVIVYFRRRMPESPRYLAQVEGREEDARRHLARFGRTILGDEKAMSGIPTQRLTFRHFWTEPRLFWTLVAAAGTWFFFDYAYYGNSISLPLVLKAVAPHASPLSQMAWSLMIFTIAAVPGYALAFWRIDRIGHRRLQFLGFFIMGLAFLALGLIPALSRTIWPFLGIFGLSYFFAEFGPNTTTFVLSTEVFPVSLRTTGNGISAGTAKLGAFVGVFLFPALTAHWGLSRTLLLTAAFSFAGMALTALLPEPAGRSLEDIAETVVRSESESLSERVE